MQARMTLPPARASAARSPERRNTAARARLVDRIRSEFEALPGLTLTPAQARRLFCVDVEAAARILAELVRLGALVRTPSGRYAHPNRAA